MPLPVIVGLIVLGVIVAIGMVAYAIDESAERNEHSPDVPKRRS
jgi:hypothetical protein